MENEGSARGGQDDFDHVIARYDLETGALLQRIDMGEVRRQNRHVHIFDVQREKDVPDRVHGNDIEELTADRAAAFPGFEAGDLLLSYRVPNLVFVIDPDTLDIKWWRIGPWGS